jgi:hypothetical protein
MATTAEQEAVARAATKSCSKLSKKASAALPDGTSVLAALCGGRLAGFLRRAGVGVGEKNG